jgi:hypothetical protein
LGWALVTALAVTLVGCGNNRKHVAQPVDAPPVTIATTTTLSPEKAAILAAWRHYWDVYLAVGSDIHMPDPRLAAVATGDELKQLGSTFLAAQAGNQELRGSIDLEPTITSDTATQATIQDCYFSHIVVTDRTSGDSVATQRKQRTLVTATFVLDSGAWKVASIRHDGDGCSSTV